MCTAVEGSTGWVEVAASAADLRKNSLLQVDDRSINHLAAALFFFFLFFSEIEISMINFERKRKNILLLIL